MSEKILYEVENHIATITVNRPEVRNALDGESWLMLKQAFIKADEDRDVRVIILTGAGEKAFIAGADLGAIRNRTVIDTYTSNSSGSIRAIEKVSKPVICAINGYCLGGGTELLLVCDISVAAENAKLGQTELNVGIIPGGGGTQRLRNAIGKSKAMEMILTGELITAQKAYELGLVNHVVPKEELMEKAKSIAAKICDKSPIGVKLVKRCVNEGANLPIEAGLLMEVLSQAVIFSTDDHLEGIDAFLQKRKPQYTGK